MVGDCCAPALNSTVLLLIPLFVLLGTRLSEIAGAVLLVALLLYSQY